jgi:hypothetical protein
MLFVAAVDESGLFKGNPILLPLHVVLTEKCENELLVNGLGQDGASHFCPPDGILGKQESIGSEPTVALEYHKIPVSYDYGIDQAAIDYDVILQFSYMFEFLEFAAYLVLVWHVTVGAEEGVDSGIVRIKVKLSLVDLPKFDGNVLISNSKGASDN